MKHCILSCLTISAILLLSSASAMADTHKSNPVVKPGIEVLRERHFDVLRGKRVGLVTNPTGVDNQLRSTIDILFEAPEVNLVALYGPEHGVRGNIYAGDVVNTEVDERTGLTMFSIFGKTRKPTKEMLADVDVLVYDIQDNGCRSYTFISTLGMLMEACAEYDKELVVLDRPNPLGGRKIEGSITEDGYVSFVSQFKIPYLYGLTVGELATMVNEESRERLQFNRLHGISAPEELSKSGELPQPCRLTVVPMQGWRRDMLWEDTGLPWVPSSPHVQTGHTAYFYPMTGIIGEFGYYNIGVGYTLPFELFGAPWINAEKLAEQMNKLELKGILFRPIHYSPFYSVFKGEQIQGVQLYLTDYDAACLTEVQFRLLEVLNKMYPERVFFKEANPARFRMFDIVCGTGFIREAFQKNYSWDDCKKYWDKDIDAFRERSAKYYLYE